MPATLRSMRLASTTEQGFYRHVGHTVLTLRQERRLSQQDLADLIRVPRNSLSTWERSQQKFPLYPAYQISHHFGFSVDALCGIESLTPLPDTVLREHRTHLMLQAYAHLSPEAQDMVASLALELHNLQRKELV